jgi:hypothetical protein
MIAVLWSLFFIVLTSAFLFFLLYILYPNLEQQNFPTDDPLVMPMPAGWPDAAKKPLFLFNSPADCHVVRLISSGKEGRQGLCAGFEKCVDICPRLNFSGNLQNGAPMRTCPFEQEMAAEHAKQYRVFAQRLSAIQKKFQNKSRGET